MSTHKQGILGGIDGDLAKVICVSKFKIGEVVTLIGNPSRALTVVGSIRRDDGEPCAVAVWFDYENHSVQSAFPEAALEKYKQS